MGVECRRPRSGGGNDTGWEKWAFVPACDFGAWGDLFFLIGSIIDVSGWMAFVTFGAHVVYILVPILIYDLPGYSNTCVREFSVAQMHASM